MNQMQMMFTHTRFTVRLLSASKCSGVTCVEDPECLDLSNEIQTCLEVVSSIFTGKG